MAEIQKLAIGMRKCSSSLSLADQMPVQANENHPQKINKLFIPNQDSHNSQKSISHKAILHVLLIKYGVYIKLKKVLNEGKVTFHISYISIKIGK